MLLQVFVVGTLMFVTATAFVAALCRGLAGRLGRKHSEPSWAEAPVQGA